MPVNSPCASARTLEYLVSIAEQRSLFSVVSMKVCLDNYLTHLLISHMIIIVVIMVINLPQQTILMNWINNGKTGFLKLICESSIQILFYTKNTYINACTVSDIHKNRTGEY